MRPVSKWTGWAVVICMGFALAQEELPAGAIARLGTLRMRHEAPVRAIAYSPDGRTLAAADSLGFIRFRDAASGEDLWQVRAHLVEREGGVTMIAFSPDGETLATTGVDGSLILWDMTTRAERSRSQLPAPVTELAWLPDGKRIAVLDREGTFRILAAGTIEEATGYGAIEGGFTTFAFSPDGRRLAIGADPIRLYDLVGGDVPLAMEGLRSPVVRMAWSPDGTRLYAAYESCQFAALDAATGKPLPDIGDRATTAVVLAFSPDSTRIAAGSWRDFVRVYRIGTGELLLAPEGCQGAVESVAVSPLGRIATAGADGVVRLYETKGGREVGQFKGHRSDVKSLAFSPDGSRLVSAGFYDSRVCRWDVDRGERLTTLTIGTNQPEHLGFLPDGTTFVLSTWNGLKLFSAKDGSESKKLAVEGMSWSSPFAVFHNGRQVAVVTDLGEAAPVVRLVDIETGSVLKTFPGDGNCIQALAIDRDGKLLVTGSLDNRVCL